MKNTATTIQRLTRITLLALLAYFIVACASLSPDYDEPAVEVIGIRADPEAQPLGFLISLRVINPNNVELAFNGIFYQLSIEGHDVLSGTANDIPAIPAYSEDTVILKASPSLLGSLGLVADLMSAPQDQDLRYELDVKLDLKNHLSAYRINRKGKLELGPTKARQAD